MSKILYLEGSCGISGDMTVAALLDLGASRAKLDTALQSLAAQGDGFSWSVSRKSSYSIAGCDFDVHLRHHEQPHEEGYHHHHHHRHLADVKQIIARTEMSDRARKLALRIFTIVAEAEAHAHGCTVDEVHFHEVGAWDSLADIIGAAVLIDDLEIDDCVVTALTEGEGTIQCQHGELPVPVPAVLNIAQAHAIPLRRCSVRGEMVTPTGIAIAAALRTLSSLPEQYRVLQTGIGLGKRDFGRANFLRAMLLEPDADPEQIYEIAANIDDSTPEELGFLMEELFRAGARDVWFTPCVMKKNRPATVLNVLVDASLLSPAEDTILLHSSTIGLRRHPVQRTTMLREMREITLPYGTIRIKCVSHGDISHSYPEYESLRELALATGRSLRSIREDIAAALRSQTL